MYILMVAAMISTLLASADFAPRQAAEGQALAQQLNDETATIYFCTGEREGSPFYWAAHQPCPHHAPAQPTQQPAPMVCQSGPFNAGWLVARCQNGTNPTRSAGGLCCPAPGFSS